MYLFKFRDKLTELIEKVEISKPELHISLNVSNYYLLMQNGD